jgi:hypothetical protein
MDGIGTKQVARLSLATLHFDIRAELMRWTGIQ